ncbi:MarR family winged helix-turn-helix transcriptional regulator [Nonomuraea jiangxiensis]|uniref:DNA-binding transcriptional regulator, MarR family n=1 Tax=Nonomuraea jiangxiensis TaxID=633440 RepID=A0A1G9UVP4_9ACTN|nr:MarR family transcriptional regulator [Nonomuraea jiangxiensis]SDM63887.1 DNA-binding transcriptional regulator, MarR family [Nonomuraea jiangxiensis]
MDLPPSLLAITTFTLHKVAVIHRRAVADRLSAEMGFGLWPFAVLSALDDFGPATQRLIGDRLGLDPSDMVRLMDDLIGARLAERERDPADRRRYQVTLTSAGRAALERARRVIADVERDTLAPLTADEREQLRGLALKLFTRQPGGERPRS